MRNKLIYVFLVMCVSALMLMANVFASTGPPFVWINQATLSFPDGLRSQDPENSGFGLTQAVVWEEWNGADWDVYMSFSLLNGVPLSWSPPIPVPITPVDEINPAVAVGDLSPITGLNEIHVVYQRWNPAGVGQWDVCHTWTNNLGVVWTVPIVLDNIGPNDATDPAIVFTEDLSVGGPPPIIGTLVQFTWSEFNPGTGFREIYYNAYFYDPTAPPPGRGYVLVAPVLIRGCPFGDCMYPEIASIDEKLNPGGYDYYFSIVWEEPNVNLQINIWYIDGITMVTPGLAVVVFLPAGQINPINFVGDCHYPDIAATQDYVGPPGESYYIHVNWVFQTWAAPVTFQIDSCYYSGVLPSPGAALFVPVLVPAQVAVNLRLDTPTIATKVIALAPTIFETWMCWEDNTPSPVVTPPDIWYRVGQCPIPGAFAYIMPAPLIVPYAQPGVRFEYNPELWNRNDPLIALPLVTHLVFDMWDPGVLSQEVEYIDP
jgi:hypothetical protein